MSSDNIFEKLFGGAAVSIEPSYRYYKCNLVNTKWSCIHQNIKRVDPNSADIIKCPAWIPKVLDIYMLQALVKQKNNGK